MIVKCRNETRAISYDFMSAVGSAVCSGEFCTWEINYSSDFEVVK